MISDISLDFTSLEPQCQFFVVRKKRLCRMTVKPGRQYCGEHEPDPRTNDGQEDSRIPCPNDPKHTCYVSKLEKHLSICNAREIEQPPYIVKNINSPAFTDETCPRIPLSGIAKETIIQVVDKVNLLYDKHLKDNIKSIEEQPIHKTVLPEFNEEERTESSRRHLRQASSLLWLIQREGLVEDCTCYVELGAGKGQLSYYAFCAWCESNSNSRVVLVDRASLRHKRDNKLKERSAVRIRADLAHLALDYVPAVAECTNVVGFAKHLCGVATDYALRCITADGVLPKSRGIVVATCCHHRCDHASYIANSQLQELGINGEELNTMLGIVSWATCGDGRSRERRNRQTKAEMSESGSKDQESNHPENCLKSTDDIEINDTSNPYITVCNPEEQNGIPGNDQNNSYPLSQEYREAVGRKAKALLDWGRVLYLRDRGFDARLCYYVPTKVSLENVCIVAKKVGKR
ncbi:hypothetical protein K1T71_011597 [Dendrolimus kikuchii]|uniref:Uncharacterized protein n=1 Tax=Dendrolimus kikuchii TaxID=765133 RepID=A0ACC1CLJ6_9NEOP|nr:hypothetical protein K1T71_011597 [Dendrolimus kikuchii]